MFQEVFSISSSSESSLLAENRPALRDRNKHIDYNDSANMQKQLRGATMKRKRPVRICTQHLQDKELSVNFSDFDNYSLVISDSPDCKGQSRETMETSTPLAKRTRATKTLKVGDLSHIDIVESPVSDTGYSSVQTPESGHSQSVFDTPSVVSSLASHMDSNRVGQSSLDDGRIPTVQLQKLSDSFISSAKTGSAKSNCAISRLNPASHFDNSASLFSSPGDTRAKLSRATKLLEAVRCGQLLSNDDSHPGNQTGEGESIAHRVLRSSRKVRRSIKHVNDSVEETSEEEVSDEEYVSEDDEDEEDEEFHSAECEVADLSAIEEGSDLASEEDGTSDSEAVDDDDNSEHCDDNSGDDSESGSDSCGRLRRHRDPLQRLSESLSQNHVVDRPRRKNRLKQSSEKNDTVDDITDLLELSHIDSSDTDCTRYMLTKEQTSVTSKASVERLSSHTEESEEEEEEGSIDGSQVGGEVPW